MHDYETPEAQRFAQAYAERSGVSLDWLRAHGREVRRCDCADVLCIGWQMAYIGEGRWFGEHFKKAKSEKAKPE